MEMESKPVTLATLAEGAAGEKFDRSMMDVWRNIQDPNTDPSAPRKITLECTVKPHSDREQLVVEITTKVSYAPLKKSTVPMHLSTGADGKPEAIVFTMKQDPRQQGIPFPTDRTGT